MNILISFFIFEIMVCRYRNSFEVLSTFWSNLLYLRSKQLFFPSFKFKEITHLIRSFLVIRIHWDYRLLNTFPTTSTENLRRVIFLEFINLPHPARRSVHIFSDINLAYFSSHFYFHYNLINCIRKLWKGLTKYVEQGGIYGSTAPLCSRASVGLTVNLCEPLLCTYIIFVRL